MRDGQPEAFRQEGKATGRRGQVERFEVALGVCHLHAFAARPCGRAVRSDRDVIDPSALWVGEDQARCAGAVDLHHLAVVAAGDDARAVGRR